MEGRKIGEIDCYNFQPGNLNIEHLIHFQANKYLERNQSIALIHCLLRKFHYRRLSNFLNLDLNKFQADTKSNLMTKRKSMFHLGKHHSILCLDWKKSLLGMENMQKNLQLNKCHFHIEGTCLTQVWNKSQLCNFGKQLKKYFLYQNLKYLADTEYEGPEGED